MNETDIPAHSYQLSFESSTEWTSFYAGSPEILKYWQRVAEKYGIRKYMKFNKRAVEARWDDQTAKWTVKLEDTGTGQIIEDTADVVMTGTGMLNAFRWPEIKGIESFRGALLHSAAWDNTYDYKVGSCIDFGFRKSADTVVGKKSRSHWCWKQWYPGCASHSASRRSYGSLCPRPYLDIQHLRHGSCA